MIIRILILFCICFSQGFSQVMIEAPIVVEEVAYSNHIITGVYHDFTDYIVVLDDGSSWKASNLEGKKVLGSYITLMPTAGEIFEHRMLTASGEVFDVALENYSQYSFSRIGSIVGNNIEILELPTRTVNVITEDLETLSTWEAGDLVIVGGYWKNDFDPQKRKINGCLSFVIYNYTKKNFVFSAL